MRGNHKNKIRVFVFSPFCILRPTTNRIFDMRLCDAFAGHNVNVTIIHPYTYMKENIRKSEIPKSYGLKNNVNTRMLLTPLREKMSQGWFTVILLIAFSFSALRIFASAVFSRGETVIFSRDAKLLFTALILKKIFSILCKVKVIYMCAEVKNGKLFRFVVNNADGVLAGVTSTMNAIRKLTSKPAHRFILALAPVPSFENDCSKEEARKRIQYHSVKPLIVYTGKVGYVVKELVYIIEAASMLPGYQFMVTGGKQTIVMHFQKYAADKNISNVHFTGFFNDSTFVRYYQLAADVLVSYYNVNDHLVEYNYPQKLNEYLSTHNPAVTPDFPATRDVINDRNVFFVEPDNPVALAACIRKAVENKSLSDKIAEQAFQDSKKLTFENKAAEILDFISGLK